MSVAREVEPASARGELRAEGRVRARAGAAILGGRVCDDLQRAARSARRRREAMAADAPACVKRRQHKEAA